MMTWVSDDLESPRKEERRDFLYYATAGTGAVATGAAIWPLINSMNPSADVGSASTVRIDLTGVEEGQRITVLWQGRPVFVWRRSPDAVAAARNVSLDDLVDPLDTRRENPNLDAEVPALDENRAADATGEWLVVIGVCTHLGCIPLGQDGAAVGDFGGWFCPCHGSHYDTSGRIRRGPAPRNLDIPPYELGTDLQLVIG
ncbi:ubiquinol-cytochrome c reductase iron-sulfur subunit [Nioella nitratireducens]|uniref:ubiquinol-cytochrome c reductase iron-sulfur subunit n=1 Tax=Nioella nitratireducens TaxID=1287720 RepID=UPI000A9EDC8B|nr:ubiquinol-cytochrome c reductase iron-sulfur subunit [Nioella nitratireducens]